MAQTDYDDRLTPQQTNPQRSPAEWVSFGIASLIVGAIAGLTIYSWATEGDRPPVIQVNQHQALREAGGQFYIPFEVRNIGGETAEMVQVLAELRVNGKVEERGEQQIDFLSGGETEAGAFIFRHDPRHGKLVIRVGSYKQP